MSKPRDELAQALTLEDETERKLAVVSLIDTQVQRRSSLADSRSSSGRTGRIRRRTSISTSRTAPPWNDLLAELGFRKGGRHWVLPEHDLFVEAPASFPAEEEEVVEVELRGGRSVPVLSAEDVVVDRLHSSSPGPRGRG